MLEIHVQMFCNRLQVSLWHNSKFTYTMLVNTQSLIKYHRPLKHDVKFFILASSRKSCKIQKMLFVIFIISLLSHYHIHTIKNIEMVLLFIILIGTLLCLYATFKSLIPIFLLECSSLALKGKIHG